MIVAASTQKGISHDRDQCSAIDSPLDRAHLARTVAPRGSLVPHRAQGHRVSGRGGRCLVPDASGGRGHPQPSAGIGCGGRRVTAMDVVRRHRIGLIVALTALAWVLLIGEDAREPNGPLPVDRRILRFAVDHRPGVVVTLARVISHLGDPALLVLLAIFVTAVLWRRFRAVLPSIVPLGALMVASVIESTAKAVIGRPRPPVAFHLLAESDASFPSGHATGSAAFYVALALVLAPAVRHRVGQIALVAGAAVIAALIGISRVVLGVHWVTDITVGWLLGVACAIGAVVLAELAASSGLTWFRWRARLGPGR